MIRSFSTAVARAAEIADTAANSPRPAAASEAGAARRWITQVSEHANRTPPESDWREDSAVGLRPAPPRQSSGQPVSASGGRSIKTTPLSANTNAIAHAFSNGRTLDDIARQYGATRMQVLEFLREGGVSVKNSVPNAVEIPHYQADNTNIEVKTAMMLAFRAATRLAC